MPKYANLVQFSDILQHKKIQRSYYIQNIDAVCIIAQDWTIDSKRIVIFYTVLNYKTKLTNSIHFIVFCTNVNFTTTDYQKKLNNKKQEESAQYITKVDQFSMPKMFGRFSCFPKDWTRHYAQWYPEYQIRLNNQIRREHFAILHHALKNHFATNKATTTNKAVQVLFNRRFNMHISQYV